MTIKQAGRFSLKSKVALILGGSSGIGREIALAFHDAGAAVVAVGKTASKVAEVDATLAARGAKCKGYCVDVTDAAGLTGLVGRTIAECGRIDVLVNSQGITILKPAVSFTRADYDQILATNLTSVFFACTEVGKHMLERGSGSIINIASVAAHRGFHLSAPYTVSKHGVLGLTRRVGHAWREGQCHFAWIFYDAAQQKQDVAASQGNGSTADANEALWRARGARRCRHLSRLTLSKIRHRPVDCGRWGLFGCGARRKRVSGFC